MNKAGPIIIIEDDVYDQKLLNEVFTSLQYPMKFSFSLMGKKRLSNMILFPKRVIKVTDSL